MIDTLRTITQKVAKLLEDNPETRNSDYYLFYEYCKRFHNLDLEKITAKDYFIFRQDYKLPNFESVGRARRKIQEMYPSLQATEEVRMARRANQEAYCSYALER